MIASCLAITTILNANLLIILFANQNQLLSGALPCRQNTLCIFLIIKLDGYILSK
jgi:hypothetical protein